MPRCRECSAPPHLKPSGQCFYPTKRLEPTEGACGSALRWQLPPLLLSLSRLTDSASAIFFLLELDG